MGTESRSTYTPTPIDTSAVELDPAIERDLLETLAEHNHDIWARERIRAGWTYGPERNDPARKHPCLVPYAELPEGEKEYDRRTAREALKAIAAGYRLGEERPASGTSGQIDFTQKLYAISTTFHLTMLRPIG